MREIKFKVWDKMFKEWVENRTVYQYGNVSSNGTWLPSSDVELCQFTGLLDKNGKEIYEGDILKSSYTEFGHEVSFENGAFKIKHNKRCCPPYKTSLSEADGWQIIIGNIYQNLELLNQ